MAIFIAYPWAAGVVAAAFALLWLARPARLVAATAFAWAAYGAYEYLMYARVLCSGECNIRVDLLLMYPALGILSLIALYRAARSPSSRPSG
jgi:hypothetical protein